MTAIGFELMVLGALVVFVYGDPRNRGMNIIETAGSGLLLLGSLILSVGVATWLWQVMP